MSYSCPVCNKKGIPDYTRTATNCPQCNSDLRAFIVLRSITKLLKIKKYHLIVLWCFSLLVIFLGIFLFETSSRVNNLRNENISLKNNIDSIILTNTLMDGLELTDDEQIITLKYTVQKGDYPYKIAQFFYGDGNMYKKIEADNGLVQPYVLKVGQTLKINIKP